jgi:hypothetical protein
MQLQADQKPMHVTTFMQLNSHFRRLYYVSGPPIVVSQRGTVGKERVVKLGSYPQFLDRNVRE